MDERRLSLKEVVQQGWDQVRDQFLEQLRGTMEGLLEAERDRRVTQLCQFAAPHGSPISAGTTHQRTTTCIRRRCLITESERNLVGN